jgi:hypothetical protein
MFAGPIVTDRYNSISLPLTYTQSPNANIAKFVPVPVTANSINTIEEYKFAKHS